MAECYSLGVGFKFGYLIPHVSYIVVVWFDDVFQVFELGVKFGVDFGQVRWLYLLCFDVFEKVVITVHHSAHREVGCVPDGSLRS